MLQSSIGLLALFLLVINFDVLLASNNEEERMLVERFLINGKNKNKNPQPTTPPLKLQSVASEDSNINSPDYNLPSLGKGGSGSADYPDYSDQGGNSNNSDNKKNGKIVVNPEWRIMVPVGGRSENLCDAKYFEIARMTHEKISELLTSACSASSGGRWLVKKLAKILLKKDLEIK